MKHVIFLFSLFALVSCKGQINLDALKFGESLPAGTIDSSGEKVWKDDEPLTGITSYGLTALQRYKLGDVSLSKYEIPKGYPSSKNILYICVDNYQNNKCIGFRMFIVQKEEQEKIFAYLKKKYGEPENHDTENSKAYFWNANDKWIFLTQEEDINREDKKYLTTKLMMVKSGTKVANSTDPKVYTILESLNLTYPKK